MSKEVGAGGRFDNFLDSAIPFAELIFLIISYLNLSFLLLSTISHPWVITQ